MKMHLFNTAKVQQHQIKNHTKQNTDHKKQLLGQRRHIHEQQQQILKLMDSKCG